jgi:hypothetical protein
MRVATHQSPGRRTISATGGKCNVASFEYKSTGCRATSKADPTRNAARRMQARHMYMQAGSCAACDARHAAVGCVGG